MKFDTSRRIFLAAGWALPAAGLASTTLSPAPASPRGKFTYRVLGKTGMKVSTVSDKLVDGLRTAKQQGKARFVGVNTHDLPAVVDPIIECKLDVLQTLYSFASPAAYGPASR